MILLCTGLVWWGGVAQAAQLKCLRCHQPHYTTRGSCPDCHRGDGRSDRPAIAHRNLIRGSYAFFALPGSAPVARGEKLAQQFACRRCHNLGVKGNSLASNLDRLGQTASPEEISRSIRHPALYMPDFACDERQLADLVTFILAAGRNEKAAGAETPQVVHFEDRRRTENIFEKKCGPCHKVLTRKWGALGRGNIGPNLSGLLTRFYPLTGKHGTRWTPEALRKWLDNPRAQRPTTQMQPVQLKKEEMDRVLEIFGEEPLPG